MAKTVWEFQSWRTFYSFHNAERDFSENSAEEKHIELDNITIETFQNKMHQEKEREVKPTSPMTHETTKSRQHVKLMFQNQIIENLKNWGWIISKFDENVNPRDPTELNRNQNKRM